MRLVHEGTGFNLCFSELYVLFQGTLTSLKYKVVPLALVLIAVVLPGLENAF
jgi:hypothetical protein